MIDIRMRQPEQAISSSSQIKVHLGEWLVPWFFFCHVAMAMDQYPMLLLFFGGDEKMKIHNNPLANHNYFALRPGIFGF